MMLKNIYLDNSIKNKINVIYIMAMRLTISNVFQLIAALSPMILGFLMVMLSIFNQDLKGIVYLSGILLTSLVNVLLLNLIKHERYTNEEQSCRLIDTGFLNEFNVPSLTSVFIAFTATYLILPMMSNSQYNYGLIIFLISLFMIDAVSEIINKCTTYSGIILGMLSGCIFGLLWYTIFHSSGYDSLLYFNAADSNKVYCSKPKKQTFKCEVYKNGELIKTL